MVKQLDGLDFDAHPLIFSILQVPSWPLSHTWQTDGFLVSYPGTILELADRPHINQIVVFGSR